MVRTLSSVSYTHLDVYKRQVFRKSLQQPVVERPLILELQGADRMSDVFQRVFDWMRESVHRVDAPPVARIVAVSYTHLDVYKRQGSTYFDPHDEPPVAFKDLPNRFPSVLSRDFRRDAGAYEDFDNLYAMHLLYNLGRYRVQVNEQTLLLEVKQAKRCV